MNGKFDFDGFLLELFAEILAERAEDDALGGENND